MAWKEIGGVNVELLYHRYRNRLQKEDPNVKVGFGLFGVGLATALVSLVLFVWAWAGYDPGAAGYFIRMGPASALAMVTVPLLLMGIVVLLPPDKLFRDVAIAGSAIMAIATVAFLWAYPEHWYASQTDYTMEIVVVYALGAAGLAAGVGASMKEHAIEVIEAVTQIHQPGEGLADEEESAAAESAAAEPADDEPDRGEGPITLVLSGERYHFDDGDTFGRRDEEWLDDLIMAADGHDEIPYVSGEHLEFSVEPEGVYVTDNSRNGTKLNGEELDGDTAQLEDGDTLILAGRAKVGVELD